MESESIHLKQHDIKADISNIFFFTLKLFAISSFIGLIAFLITDITNILNTPFDVLMIKLISNVGSLCVFIGIVGIGMTGCVNQSARMAVTAQAARYRTPNQNQFSNEFIKRQMSDWHRIIGAFFLLIVGFMLLGLTL